MTTLNKNDQFKTIHDVRRIEALQANRYLNKIREVNTIIYDQKVFDGSIHSEFTLANFQELTQIVIDEEPDELITLCFEAGHQDHDSVELITRIISKNHNLKMRCFSSYRASAISPRLFSVLKPIAPKEKISFNRFFLVLVSLRLMFIYKSQIKTWLGLGPALLFKYSFMSFRESEKSPSMYPEIIPHCFYETRGRASQREVFTSHQKFVSNFLSKG